MCPDVRRNDSEMVTVLEAVWDLRLSHCLINLEAGARVPPGRTQQAAVALARPGAAGR